MKFLIVDDDILSRRLLQKLLSSFGECHIARDGEEAVNSFRVSLEENSIYDLICLDIMMPKIDGQEALKMIRHLEQEHNVSKKVKVIMITCLEDVKSVIDAYYKGKVNSYIIKPLLKEKLYEELYKLGIITKEQLQGETL
jgi:two-component system chemotaxis response regulator CheY